MKVISTNIAEPREIEWRGKKVKTGIYKTPVDQPIILEKEDVRNDHVLDRRYHGGIDKACYLYSKDSYSFWQRKYPKLDWQWGMFGENLTVEGLDESSINIGDVYEIGEAVVQVSQPRQPCYKLGVRFGNQSVVREFLESSYPGVYVRVLKDGAVRKGDVMNLMQKAANSLSLVDVFSLFSRNIDNKELLEQAISIPELGEACRKDLKKLLSFS
ncbi:MOSC domain-containing protein [Sunxiuqinia sp. A32]|uniref:MOSC domain-containing protein n=1 Tax=Sunxiuqinia sp. A32 TaxID=3461496 RepID=UPI004045C45B